MTVRLQSEARGTWRITVSAGVDRFTGKRVRVVETFQATAPSVAGQRKEALARERQIKTEVEQRRRGGSAQTVAFLLTEWFAQVELAANTRRDYKSAINRYLIPHLGAMRLTKLNAWDLDKLYRQLAQQGLGPARIRKVHSTISAALAQAVRWQWIPNNPAMYASPPRLKQPEIVLIDPAEVQRVLDHLEEHDPMFWCFILLGSSLGARPAEVCALQWGDFDLDNGQVTIRRAVDPDGVKVPKTGKFRTVGLSPRVVQAVKQHRLREAEVLLKAGIRLQPDHFLFHTDHDSTKCGSTEWFQGVCVHGHRADPSVPIRRDYASKRFARWRDELRLDPKFQLKNLRHYVATQMLGAGVDVRTVAGRLGHSSPAMTLNRYAQFLPAKDKEAAELLDRLLEGES